MKKVRISVVIPTYNRAWCIQRAINSVVEQDYADWELIIVDDGSNDDTKDKVFPFLADKRIKFLHQNNEGVACARYQGLLMCRGDIVVFLDSDDALLGSKVFNRFDLDFKKFGGIDSFGGLVYKVKDPTGRIRGKIQKFPMKIGFNEIVQEKISGENFFVLSRECLLKIDYPLNYETGSEFVLWFEFLSKYVLISQDFSARMFYFVNERRDNSRSVTRALKIAPKMSLAYEFCLEKYGEKMTSLNSHYYNRFLFSSCYWKLLSGKRHKIISRLFHLAKKGELKYALILLPFGLSPQYIKKIMLHLYYFVRRH